MESPLVILPCAGFGVRVGRPPAKELLPLRGLRPLIEEPLLTARAFDFPALVITRSEKVSLLEYCREQFAEVDICLVPETEEWPHTILLSKAHWRPWNLLVLPDTDYLPKNIWQTMIEFANSNTDLVVAEHSVTQPEKWGQVFLNSGKVWLAEKVHSPSFDCDKAWGLLLFRKEIGETLFQTFIESRKRRQFLPLQTSPERVRFLELESFKDLTRG